MTDARSDPQDDRARSERREDAETAQSEGQFPRAREAPLVAEEGVNEGTEELAQEAPEDPATGGVSDLSRTPGVAPGGPED